MIPVTVYIFLLIELIAVSYIDLVQRRISNYWIILNLCFFVTFLLIMTDFYSLKMETFFYSIVFFLVGFFLFQLKIMGGGDSKYLFSLYLLIPVDFHDSAFICLIYSTIIVGSNVFLLNIFKNRKRIHKALLDKNIKSIKFIFGSKFPFVPVVLLSWIWFGWINRATIFF